MAAPQRIMSRVRHKPLILLLLPILYGLLLLIGRFQFHVSWQMALFAIGIVAGIFFLDVGEEVFVPSQQNIPNQQGNELTSGQGGQPGVYDPKQMGTEGKVNPSPFRTMLFVAGVCVMAFYVVTSTNEPLGQGMVLSLLFSILLYQVAQWRAMGNLDSWYTFFFGSVPVKTEEYILIALGVFQIILTILFVSP